MELNPSAASEVAKEAEALALKLKEMYAAIVHPFPYGDIRHIKKTVTSRKIATRRAMEKGFIPDLDLYLPEIAGCCSWGKKALGWNADTREFFARLMSKEFFEKHPEYILVRRWITEANTPHLYQELNSHNEMRINVLALIRLLERLEECSH